MAPGRSTAIAGQGGTPPYTYSIVPSGAGGSVVPVGGGSTEAVYTAPANAPTDPRQQYVTLKVVDSLAAEATAQILIGDPLLLFCEIIQRELGLANGRVYLYNQKIMQPTDDGLYIAVGVLNCKPFGNTNRPITSGDGLQADQSVNMLAQLDLNVISRSTAALMRKEEVIMALASTYAVQQQERNSFFIGKLPPGGQFVNISNVDGAAIPYRFNISVNIQYFARKVKENSYFDQFSEVEVTTES
jgi:hypothetical protein